MSQEKRPRLSISPTAALRVLDACNNMTRASQSTCIRLSRQYLGKLLHPVPLPPTDDMVAIGHTLFAESGRTQGAMRLLEVHCRARPHQLVLQAQVPRAAELEEKVRATVLQSAGKVRHVATPATATAAEELAVVAQLAVELGLAGVVVVSPWPAHTQAFQQRAAGFANALADELGSPDTSARYLPLQHLARLDDAAHLLVDAAHMLGTTGHYEWCAAAAAGLASNQLQSIVLCGALELTPPAPGLTLCHVFNQPVPPAASLLQTLAHLLREAPHTQGWRQVQSRSAAVAGGGAGANVLTWTNPAAVAQHLAHGPAAHNVVVLLATWEQLSKVSLDEWLWLLRPGARSVQSLHASGIPAATTASTAASTADLWEDLVCKARPAKARLTTLD